jgi:hypothetical protein
MVPSSRGGEFLIACIIAKKSGKATMPRIGFGGEYSWRAEGKRRRGTLFAVKSENFFLDRNYIEE